MAELIGTLLRLLLAALGMAVAADPGAVTLCAAVLLATALVIVLLHAVGGRSSSWTALRRPRRAIDISAMLPQSDPDAAGHPRSRAPGHAGSAA
jgi:hypothetical protein